MSNVDINVDRRMDGRTENRTPISHPATSRCDNKASKHCDCQRTITNAYGQCIEKDEFSKLPLSDPQKLGLFPCSLEIIKPMLPCSLKYIWVFPWSIENPGIPFTVRAGNKGRNKIPYEKVPVSVAWFGPANKWAQHGHFYLMCRKKQNKH